MYSDLHKLCLILLYFLFLCYFHCHAQDPWDLKDTSPTREVDDDKNIPPDLRIKPTKRTEQTGNSYGIGEWFYRRILSIVLKGGQVKENEDGSVDILLQMQLDQKKWSTLQNYLSSTTALSEEKLRRSLGYIEQSIHEPSLPNKIVLALSEHIQFFLLNYKSEITWTLALLAVSALPFWLWRRMSHKSAVVIIFVAFYAYEVFISYKEAEQKEIEMFVAAVNSCKWFVWSSKCELPKPDPLVFLKHMNPLKILIRMFTTIISEPIIVLSDTVKTLTHGLTDGLWYPLDVIMYGIFVTFFNIILLIFLITIIFNYILNIPINVSFGLFSVIFRQRKRNFFSDNDKQSEIKTGVNNTNDAATNAITGATLDKLLDVVTRALNAPTASNFNQHAAVQGNSDSTRRQITNSTTNGLKRSASTGRLPNQKSFENHGGSIVTKRKLIVRYRDGAGDAR